MSKVIATMTGPLDVVRNAAYLEGDPQFDYDKALRKYTPQMANTDDIAIFADIDSHGIGRAWESDVGDMCSSEQWLRKYSLRHYRLDLDSILGFIGFRHSSDYDKMVKKPVCSRYADGMFARFTTPDGKAYNVIATRDKLQQYERRLHSITDLYSRRLEWLTTESRRTFGVIHEKNVCIILNLCTSNEALFNHYLAIVRAVLRQQVASKNRVNLIRSSDIVDSWCHRAVPITKDSLEAAISWLDTLYSGAVSSPTALAEAVLKASNDSKVDAIYLFTGGYDPVSAREILLQQTRLINIPMHVVAFNVLEEESLSFLRELAYTSRGKFHAYTINWCVDDYDVNPSLSFPNNSIVPKRYLYGGVPAGAGVREDVFKMYEEIETAKNNLAVVQTIMRDLPESQLADQAMEKERIRAERRAKAGSKFAFENSEEYMSSREWLERYGLRQRKLDLYDVLAGVAFRHCDGVVDLGTNPGVSSHQTDAILHQKLVNARYCNQFAHLRWRDGSLVHVQVTGDIHRSFTESLKLAVEAIQKRIDWLKSGSRELFGSILENQVYIVIDISASMAPSLQFVKDKIFQLMQEQLRHKTKFNLVAFNTKVYAWKTRLTPIAEETLRNAWQWIRQLECSGSTNTMAALDYAMGDPETEAVYLLTDGRPDQPGSAVLAQATHRRVLPIHTISFNCHDAEANQFLSELARVTNGRFHAFSSSGDVIIDPFSDEPEPWESEDVKILRQELATGREYADTMTQLRKECIALSWNKNTRQSKGVKEPYQPIIVGVNLSARDRFEHTGKLLRHVGNGASLFDLPPPKSMTNPPNSQYAFGPQPDKMVDLTKRPIRPNVARHTKSSILRLVRDDRSPSPQNWHNSPVTLGFRPSYLKDNSDLSDSSSDSDMKANLAAARKHLTKSQSTSAINRKSSKIVKSTSVKRWLAKNGLSAKKLQAIDVLAPLMFAMHRKISNSIVSARSSSPHPKDEFQDLARIMDEVLPVSSRRYVPQDDDAGVNFDALNRNLMNYEGDLTKLINHIENHLSKLAWKAVGDADKRQINPLKHLEPVPFRRYRSELMPALDKAGWRQLSRHDIELLDREIDAAETCLKQCRNFQMWLDKRNRSPKLDVVNDALASPKTRPESAADTGIPIGRKPVQITMYDGVSGTQSAGSSSSSSSSSDDDN